MSKIIGALISLDLTISLPIVSTAVLLLLYTWHMQTLSLSSLSTNSVMQLKLYTISQIIASVIDSYPENNSGLISFISNYSSENLIQSQILQLSNSSPAGCETMGVCRIVTLNGKSIILVLSHENTG